MNYVVYCVLREKDRVPDRLPLGVGGGRVSLLAEDGLAVAFSRVRLGCAVPSLSRVKAYARVVEALHKTGTVLPMRYGCELSTRAQLVELLREHRAEFQAALDEVEGCVELGIRVLLREAHGPVSGDVGRPSGPSPARVYLASRKACYSEQDQERGESAAVARRIQKAFDQLFVRCLAEPSFAGRERLLTLHFLVHRQDHELFCQAFRRLEKRTPEKLLLTGPWPPYNIASCHQATPSRDRMRQAFSLDLPVNPASALPPSPQEKP